MFELANVEAGYGKIKVLQGVSLQVRPGEIVGLIGRNGVGKTTTLKAIMGLLPVAAGRVTFNGQDLTELAPHRIPGVGIGYVPQGRGIFSMLSVQENLCLGLRGTPKQAELDALVFSRFPRLRERLSQLAGTLSGGEQQMLAIARALVMQPKLLLLDEPTEGVMPILVKAIQEQVLSVNQSGVAVLLVEQNVKAAARLSDRVYVMEKGRVVDELSSTAYRTDPNVLAERMSVTFTKPVAHAA